MISCINIQQGDEAHYFGVLVQNIFQTELMISTNLCHLSSSGKI